MENEIIEVQATTAELIAAKCSRLIDIESELQRGDYKHSRQLREKQIGCSLTMSEEDYNAFCLRQKELTKEYNAIELEVAELQVKLASETDVFNNSVI